MTIRKSKLKRETAETRIEIAWALDGHGTNRIDTGIPFFNHMLTLFAVHGFFDMDIKAKGDIEVDYHHTVEDVGIVLGDVFDHALGDRKQIKRYGHAVTPMDETLTAVSVDLSKRPFLVYNTPAGILQSPGFNLQLAGEFFRAFTNKGGLNLHINVMYGENEHHIIESIFKALGRALDQATAIDERVEGWHSSKGTL